MSIENEDPMLNIECPCEIIGCNAQIPKSMPVDFTVTCKHLNKDFIHIGDDVWKGPISPEHRLYRKAIEGMDKKAKYRLANMMAHNYEIEQEEDLTFLKRGESEMYALTKCGKMYRLTECV